MSEAIFVLIGFCFLHCALLLDFDLLKHFDELFRRDCVKLEDPLPIVSTLNLTSH
jgi:hypothetical protein